MKALACAALAVLLGLLISTEPGQAQVGSAHFAAWDRHEGKKVTRNGNRKAVRTAYRAKRSVHARLSPAIAREPAVRAIRPVLDAANKVTSLATRILPHPPGCPRRLFCGCGAAIEVFGKPIRHLWLAANWLRYPAAKPGPGMVAARRGHVMVIRKYLGNGRAYVYDANSGGGKTRLHVRSLAGFKVVNPRARA